MTNTKPRPEDLEAEARRFAKLAQFEFSPIAARHLRGTAERLMAQAAEIRSAELQAAAREQLATKESWLLRVGREADLWYGERAAARMRGDFL